MSATSDYPDVREWLRRLVTGQPHQVIGGLADPYLRRWYVIPRNPWLNIYVHQFLRSDDDRALHDHPWWFVSLILWGQYDEVTERGVKRRRAGSIAFRPAEWRHRVQLVAEGQIYNELPCWTLIVTGRRSRTWGFWCRAKACPSCGTTDPVLRGGPSFGYGCYHEWHDSTASRRDRELAASLRAENGDCAGSPERFVPWDQFGDAGCGER